MNKIITAFCLSMFLSIGVFAQNQTQNNDEDYNKNEIYAGFSHQRDAQNSGENYNGFEVAYTRNVHRYFGIKGSFSAAFDKDSFAFPTVVGPGVGSTLAADQNQQRYNFLGGVQIKDNASQKRLKPFGHALIGASTNRFATGNLRCVSGNCQVFPQGSTNFSFTQTRFTLAVGGGLDVKINEKFDLRAIQVDYNPVFFSGYTQSNVRFGVGIVIK